MRCIKPLIPKTLPEFVKRTKTGIAMDTPPRRPCRGAEVVMARKAMAHDNLRGGLEVYEG